MLRDLIEAARYELGEDVSQYLTVDAHYVKSAGKYNDAVQELARDVAERLVDQGSGRLTGKTYILDPVSFLDDAKQQSLMAALPSKLRYYCQRLSAEAASGEESVIGTAYSYAGAAAAKAAFKIEKVTSPKSGKTGYRISMQPAFEKVYEQALKDARAYYRKNPKLAAHLIDKHNLKEHVASGRK